MEIDVETKTPELVAVIAEIDSDFAKLKSFQITDSFEFENANLLLKDIKSRSKRLKEQQLSMTRPINAAKDAIMAHFAKPTEMLERCQEMLLSAMNDWNKKQELALRAERERLQKLAEEKAAKMKQELIAKAEVAVEEGDVETAEYNVARAESLTVQTTYVSPAKAIGARTLTTWKFRIVDRAKVPEQFKLIDEKTLGAMARSMKDKAKVEGVEFYPETNLV